MTRSQQEALDFLEEATSPNAGPQLEAACRSLSAVPPEEIIDRLCILFWHAPAERRVLLGPLLLGLAGRLRPRHWARLEDSMRRRWPFAPVTAEPSQIPLDDPAAVLVALCHPSGHLRERAVGMAEKLPASVAVALLLVRMNDWVERVRARAQEHLPPILQALSPGERLSLAPLAERLRYCGRHGLNRGFEYYQTKYQAFDRWLEEVIGPFEEEAWLHAWRSAQPGEKALYLQMLKETGKVPGPSIRRALFTSHDRLALVWYLQGVVPRLGDHERVEALSRIGRSRAVPVRRLWLSQRIENEPDAVVGDLRDLLADRSRTLRHFARFHLERLAQMDFAAHYRTALSDPRQEPWALRGLVEVAAAEGQREALARLDSTDDGVKKAAIECLDAKVLGEHLDRLLSELDTGGPGVTAAVRKRLTEVLPQLGGHLLSSWPDRRPTNEKSRLYLIGLAPYFSKWDGLEFLLRLAPEPDLHAAVVKHLTLWRERETRAYLQLPPARRDRLLQLLEGCGLIDPLRETLHFLIARA